MEKKKIKALFVCGTFDDDGGKVSTLALRIFRNLNLPNVMFINSGHFNRLTDLIQNHVKEFNVIFWFADVPNNKPKIIEEIKKKHEKCILITSKRNLEKKYDLADLVYHALNIKSNVFIEITKNEKDRYQGRILDPLGNVFLDHCDNFETVGKALSKRVNQLYGYTRIPSIRIGEEGVIPEKPEFFEIIRKHGNTFHELVHSHPNAVNRYFGNASFRCESGFPSFRYKNLIFVSRRNMDKRTIDKTSFIAVRNDLIGSQVKYYGNLKPSVDTPIQVLLYGFYFNVNYMLHSHVHVEGAPFTDEVIPCGSVEEAQAIFRTRTDCTASNFAVNLSGHGSLLLARDLGFLRNVKFYPRNVPEMVHERSKECCKF